MKLLPMMLPNVAVLSALLTSRIPAAGMVVVPMPRFPVASSVIRVVGKFALIRSGRERERGALCSVRPVLRGLHRHASGKGRTKFVVP